MQSTKTAPPAVVSTPNPHEHTKTRSKSSVRRSDGSPSSAPSGQALKSFQLVFKRISGA